MRFGWQFGAIWKGVQFESRPGTQICDDKQRQSLCLYREQTEYATITNSGQPVKLLVNENKHMLLAVYVVQLNYAMQNWNYWIRMSSLVRINSTQAN